MSVPIRYILLFTYLGFLFSCDHLPHNKTPYHCHIKRGAIDIGSGSTKVLVAKIDKCKKKVLKIISEKKFAFKFKESLHLHDNRISNELENKAISSLSDFIKSYPDIPFHGVATEVFRQAYNGADAIKRMARALKIPLEVITQEQEAILGYWGAIGISGSDPESTVIWDIGGGSMQMIARSSKVFETYLGKLASVSFKNALLKEQGKTRGSPNPIGRHLADWAINYASSFAKKNVSEKMKRLVKERKVIGIGSVHYYSLRNQLKRPKDSPFSLYDLDREIRVKVNYKDQKLLGAYRETEVTNLILVYGFMTGLGIESVQPIKVNMATGVLFHEDLW